MMPHVSINCVGRYYSNDMIGAAHTSPEDNEARNQTHHDEAHSFLSFMVETSWAHKCQVSSIRRIRQTEHCTMMHQR
jgi:hypothetical protein